MSKNPLQVGKVLGTSGGEQYSVVVPDADVSAQSATATLTASDFNKNVTNTGAGGAITLTLPFASVVAEQIIRIQVTAAQIINLSPTAVDAIFLGGDGVLDKDLIIAGVIGNYVDLVSDGESFLVVGYSGVVTKEP